MKILGVNIDALTKKQALRRLEKPQVIFTPNPEIILLAHQQKSYRKSLEKGSLMLPDGHGLQFVSTLSHLPKFLRFVAYPFCLPIFLIFKAPFRTQIPEMIHGSDFMNDLIDWSVVNQKSVFFLGAQEGVAESAAQYFTKKKPGLKLAGHSSRNPGEAAYQEVKDSQAEVIFVAYGAPKQEKWIANYADRLPHRFHIMGVGGSFDFWSGKVKRAPKTMQRLGLEWLWRLCLDPKRRLRRIWNATVVFPLTCFSSSKT
jgi:N-acetylglucosaminyldiphosphoundecaprenol N-acetyl-beta-D-mannosaminyltransferase